MNKITVFLQRIFGRNRSKRLPIQTGPAKIAQSARFTFPKKIQLGSWVRVGKRCYLNGEGGIVIGDGTIFAPEVVILSSTHHHKQNSYLPYDEFDEFRPVTVGRGVWLGQRSMIVPGVSIGDGAIVAMGAVVTKDVAAGDIVGGNPAKVLSSRDAAFIKDMVKQERYYLKAVIEEGLSRIKSKPAPDNRPSEKT